MKIADRYVFCSFLNDSCEAETVDRLLEGPF